MSKDLLKARVMITVDSRVVIYVKEPNLGFGWVALDVEGVKPSTITRVEYYSASNIKFFKVVEPLVQALYGKKCSNIASINNVNVASYQPELIKDDSESLREGNFSAEIMSLTETDPKAKGTDGKPLTFKDYVFSTCMKIREADGSYSIGIELQEYDSQSNPHKQHRKKKNFVDSWALIPAADHPRFSIDLDPDEYQSILNRPEFQDLLDYVSYQIPGENTNNVLISGGAGSGKTKALIALAKALNKPLVLFTGTRTLDKDEMFASIIPDDVTGGWKKNKTDLGIGCEIGAVIGLEEWAVTSGELQIGINNTVYGARRFLQFQDQTYFVHPDTIFIITTNVGYKGTEAFNKAFKERFYSMYFPRLDKNMYGKYLAKKFCAIYPTISEDTILDFNSFLYDLMDYMEDNFKNLDQFDTETPSICTRDIPRIMYTSINKDSVSKALTEILRGILVGAGDPATLIGGILSKFAKEIGSIEQKLFMDPSMLKASKQSLKDLYSCFVPSIQSSSKANNASDIFDSIDSSTTDSVLNSLKTTGGFNV